MLVGENISPETNVEFWFVMFFMVSGATMTAVVFGTALVFVDSFFAEFTRLLTLNLFF